MVYRIRPFVVLAIATGVLMPAAVAQKPPAAPAPPSGQPSRGGAIPPPTNIDPSQPREDLVMFLRGRVATNDGTAVPHDVVVERVCNNRVRQQVYASSRGDFSMQLGSRSDSFPEASNDPASPYGAGSKDPVNMGISRRELMNCELRASASGFHEGVMSLLDVDAFDSNVDVGVIVVNRGTKIEGTTVSAIPYKAPKDARKAYEKGLEAERNSKLAEAQKYFETSVKLYPKSANAWFQLGSVLQKQNQKDAAEKAYTQATTIDTKFLPPYLSLASMAYETRKWADVLSLTGHILDLDPMNNVAVSSYILDLDRLNYADAYFYNAVANFRLNKVEDAEKIGLKAEHLDLRPRFPQLHLLLAEIFTQKGKYGMAIAEMQTYLELVPQAKDAEQVREQLAKVEKLNASASQ
jgi:Tetratricopeptide repeat